MLIGKLHLLRSRATSHAMKRQIYNFANIKDDNELFKLPILIDLFIKLDMCGYMIIVTIVTTVTIVNS